MRPTTTNTRFGSSLADTKAIAKAVENFSIFALQLHSNSYLYLNISVDKGSKTAEANRENVIGHFKDMITVDNNMFQDWQDYFSKTFEKSGKFARQEIGKKNTVYEEEYIPKDKDDKTKIKVSYFINDGALITCDFINPQTPGYNKLIENEFFYQYDFTPDKSYGAPGLEFNQINLDAIHKQLMEGLKGKEIKYFSGNKHIKSDVFLDTDKQAIPFTVYFDNSSFWSRLFAKIYGRQKDNNLYKQTIELKAIFGGLKNAL